MTFGSTEIHFELKHAKKINSVIATNKRIIAVSLKIFFKLIPLKNEIPILDKNKQTTTITLTTLETIINLFFALDITNAFKLSISVFCCLISGPFESIELICETIECNHIN